MRDSKQLVQWNPETVKIFQIRQKKSGNDRITIRIRSKFYGSGRKCPKTVKFKSAYGKNLPDPAQKCPETTESKSATLDQYPLYLLNIIFNNNLIFLLILHNESTCIVYCL